jgi:hypothetical protein
MARQSMSYCLSSPYQSDAIENHDHVVAWNQKIIRWQPRRSKATWSKLQTASAHVAPKAASPSCNFRLT